MQTSESVVNISKAIVTAQAELDNPKNTAINPYFKSKYAPLNDILNYVKPILQKHGLGVIQDISHDQERIVVSSMLIHTSGEWVKQTGASAKPDKDTAQGAGSAITYLRRYSLSAILNISSEDDNDGNSASKPKTKEEREIAISRLQDAVLSVTTPEKGKDVWAEVDKAHSNGSINDTDLQQFREQLTSLAEQMKGDKDASVA